MSLSTVLKACNFIENRLQHRCFPVSIPKVLGTIFFIELLQWLLLNYVLVSERIFKKESNDVATTNREVPYRLLPWYSFCCLNLITAAPLQLEIKRFVR